MVTNRSASQPSARDRSRHLDRAVAVSRVLRKSYLGELARWGSANVRGRIGRANYRMASPTHSIPAVYRCRIERTLNLTVDFLQLDPFGCGCQMCSGRIRLRPCCGEIVPNMQAKPSFVNLMRVAHTLDVVSIVNADRSVREDLTDMVFRRVTYPNPSRAQTSS